LHTAARTQAVEKENVGITRAIDFIMVFYQLKKNTYFFTLGAQIRSYQSST
jgi:hypothetical protein